MSFNDHAASQASTEGNEFLYTGRRLDPETGLYHFRTRPYHAQMGRFTTRDWIGYAGGVNLYGYAGARPTYYLDPWGLSEWNPAWPNWHHGVPMEIFGDMEIEGVDINSAEYGFVLPAGDHQQLHPVWNDDWKEWKNNYDGVIDKAAIDEQYAKINKKYSKQLERGFKPRRSYSRSESTVYSVRRN